MSRLSPNQLAFIALSNEYCQAIESAAESDRNDFVDNMLRLLPRLYITATDLAEPSLLTAEGLPQALDEEYYDAVRRGIEMILGEDDTYLEVFADDMRYSDQPIAQSIAENLADIFQVMYNLIECVKDATDDVISEYIDVAKEDFGGYWSRPLCNVLRALNNIKYY